MSGFKYDNRTCLGCATVGQYIYCCHIICKSLANYISDLFPLIILLSTCTNRTFSLFFVIYTIVRKNWFGTRNVTKMSPHAFDILAICWPPKPIFFWKANWKSGIIDWVRFSPHPLYNNPVHFSKGDKPTARFFIRYLVYDLHRAIGAFFNTNTLMICKILCQIDIKLKLQALSWCIMPGNYKMLVISIRCPFDIKIVHIPTRFVLKSHMNIHNCAEILRDENNLSRRPT